MLHQNFAGRQEMLGHQPARLPDIANGNRLERIEGDSRALPSLPSIRSEGAPNGSPDRRVIFQSPKADEAVCTGGRIGLNVSFRTTGARSSGYTET
jgi:hypothetical protein